MLLAGPPKICRPGSGTLDGPWSRRSPRPGAALAGSSEADQIGRGSLERRDPGGRSSDLYHAIRQTGHPRQRKSRAHVLRVGSSPGHGTS
eukprot:8099056-Alexandrium_andersonii.AAC.1